MESLGRNDLIFDLMRYANANRAYFFGKAYEMMAFQVLIADMIVFETGSE